MMKKMERKPGNGKWIVIALLVIAAAMSLLRWVLIPKTNPREADPGNPFYSGAKSAPAEKR
jgi:hypothetical protein